MSDLQLGLGCASMGSRKSRAESVAALERAYEAGIRWFDVAPSYGDGAAEEVLGRFASVRSDITVATKVGILPGHVGLAKKLIRPAVRMALTMAPGLRNAVKRNRPAAMKQPLTPSLIAASVDASLRRLQMERIGMLFLHGATAKETADPAVIEAAGQLIASGKVARIGIASSPDAIRAGLAASPLYTAAQFANNPFEPELEELSPLLDSRPDILVSTHSVIGSAGMVEAIAAQMGRDAALADAFGQAGYTGTPRAMVSAFLADYAIAPSRTGIVLMSMFSRANLENNMARFSRRRDYDAMLELASRIETPAKVFSQEDRKQR